MFIKSLTSAGHMSLSWATPIQSIPQHLTSWKSILILSSHLSLSSGLFPSGIGGFESQRRHGCLSLVTVVCVVRYRFPRRADHSSGGELPSVQLSVIVKAGNYLPVYAEWRRTTVKFSLYNCKWRPKRCNNFGLFIYS